ncbi:hypothetical protein [Sorangium sp. So ce117]|uniref:hypothetical protein n=1 Tax=Sorangium sp. So ce117 TaxID=3133277 RepID=UPI003F5FF581
MAELEVVELALAELEVVELALAELSLVELAADPPLPVGSGSVVEEPHAVASAAVNKPRKRMCRIGAPYSLPPPRPSRAITARSVALPPRHRAARRGTPSSNHIRQCSLHYFTSAS